MAPKNKPIIVLGVQRSGTSLVAGLVNHWDAYGGEPKNLLRSDELNPRGYYKNKFLAFFIQRFLNNEKLQFWDYEFDRRIVAAVDEAEYRDKARQLIAGMEGQNKIWFWNEPLLSVMFPFWERFWGEPVFVIPVRNPYEMAHSWHNWLMRLLPKNFTTKFPPRPLTFCNGSI